MILWNHAQVKEALVDLGASEKEKAARGLFVGSLMSTNAVRGRILQ